MADALVAMRVLRAGTNNTGSHGIGDVIRVDAPHAAAFEAVGFAARLDVTDDAEAAEKPFRPRRKNPPR